MLAAIDAAPVAIRADLGEAILSWLRPLAEAPDSETRWWFRRMTWPGPPVPHLRRRHWDDQLVQDAFSAYVMLRHQQLIELIPQLGDVMTAGVLLTPRSDGLRPMGYDHVRDEGGSGV